jgi:hypothetical protein
MVPGAIPDRKVGFELRAKGRLSEMQTIKYRKYITTILT